MKKEIYIGDFKDYKGELVRVVGFDGIDVQVSNREHSFWVKSEDLKELSIPGLSGQEEQQVIQGLIDEFRGVKKEDTLATIPF